MERARPRARFSLSALIRADLRLSLLCRALQRRRSLVDHLGFVLQYLAGAHHLLLRLVPLLLLDASRTPGMVFTPYPV